MYIFNRYFQTNEIKINGCMKKEINGMKLSVKRGLEDVVLRRISRGLARLP
jgi:hypothetical protein